VIISQKKLFKRAIRQWAIFNCGLRSAHIWFGFGSYG